VVEIRQVGLTTLMSDPAFEALSAEYAAEAAIDAIGRVSVQWPTYTALETAGLLRCFCAFNKDNALTGYLVMLLTVLPQYGALTGNTAAFFVAARARKTGAGLALLRAAEIAAFEAGAKGMCVGAPPNGRLAQVLPSKGYQHSTSIYFRGLNA
jgi:GNAT superfamily N-acetyltransferase